MANFPNVQAAADSLLGALTEGEFEYALIGGRAIVLRGHDRLTQDVDALIWDLNARLERHGFRRPKSDELRTAKANRLLYVVWKDQVQVDVAHSTSSWLETEPVTTSSCGVASNLLMMAERPDHPVPESGVIEKCVNERPTDFAGRPCYKNSHPRSVTVCLAPQPVSNKNNPNSPD